MKNKWLALCALLLPLSGVAQQKSSAKNELNIVTYNIRHAEGMDGKLDCVRLARIIAAQHPDVVALQEVDSVAQRTNELDILRILADETHMHSVFARAIPLQGGAYGVGILSKEKPLSVRRVPLPGREEARVLLVVEFGKYYMGCTHLSLTPDDQLASLPLIRNLAASLDKPFFLAGDWNATPGTPFIQDIQKDFTLLNGVKEHTWPSDKPEELLDYVAVWKSTAKHVSLKSTHVVPDSITSDHRPVCVTVRLEKTKR